MVFSIQKSNLFWGKSQIHWTSWALCANSSIISYKSQGSQLDWKNGKAFSSQEKLHKVLENSGNFICNFLMIFKCTVLCIIKWIKFSVKKQDIKKIREHGKNTGKIREFFQSGKVGTMKCSFNRGKRRLDWKYHILCWLCWFIFRSLHIIIYTHERFFPTQCVQIVH